MGAKAMRLADNSKGQISLKVAGFADKTSPLAIEIELQRI